MSGAWLCLCGCVCVCVCGCVGVDVVCVFCVSVRVSNHMSIILPSTIENTHTHTHTHTHKHAHIYTYTHENIYVCSRTHRVGVLGFCYPNSYCCPASFARSPQPPTNTQHSRARELRASGSHAKEAGRKQRPAAPRDERKVGLCAGGSQKVGLCACGSRTTRNGGRCPLRTHTRGLTRQGPPVPDRVAT